MSELHHPKHQELRDLLRSIGPAILGIGLLLEVIGMASFFSSFGSFEPPRYFWCSFVGGPLIFVGLVMTITAYYGTILRYMFGEAAPVSKDAANYMVAGTKDSIRDVATALGEGFATAGRMGVAHNVRCHKCSANNDMAANFCGRCGASLAESQPCAKCGELNDPDDRFCNNCGTAVA